MSKNNATNFSIISSENGKKQSLKTKKLEVEAHLIKYKKYKLRLECFDSITITSQNMMKEKETLQSYVIYIEKVLNLISSDSKEFLFNEYLVDNYIPLWWEQKYSRQLYIKKRHEAFNEFLLYVK